jgi:hypothetical protein
MLELFSGIMMMGARLRGWMLRFCKERVYVL